MENMARRNWDLYTGTMPAYEQPGDIINRVQAIFIYSCGDHIRGNMLHLVTHGDVIAFTLLWILQLRTYTAEQTYIGYFGISDDYPAPASLSNLDL